MTVSTWRFKLNLTTKKLKILEKYNIYLTSLLKVCKIVFLLLKRQCNIHENG